MKMEMKVFASVCPLHVIWENINLRDHSESYLLVTVKKEEICENMIIVRTMTPNFFMRLYSSHFA